MIDVVAALIENNGQFLVCQRPVHKSRGGMWEFPGGKIEPGETPQEAVVRECFEELDIQVEAGHAIHQVIHEYPDITIRLTSYHARLMAREPKPLEHQNLRWLLIEDMDIDQFCPADQAFLIALKNQINVPEDNT